MTEQPNEIRFNDGAGYEQMMGKWSRLAGDVFLDWLAPSPGLAWVDVGCGNGAFTELVVDRCRPSVVEGVDPSEAQLEFARSRPAARLARFRSGDAMALPFPDKSFDAAVMALVIFFVPQPAKGVAEMVRVVRPGGLVSAYAWHFLGGGFPLEPLQASMRDMGITPLRPPTAEAAEMPAMHAMWTDAGLVDVETRQITVERTFADFEEFWTVAQLGTSSRAVMSTMAPQKLEELKARTAARLPAAADGRVTTSARANAIKGRKPS